MSRFLRHPGLFGAAAALAMSAGSIPVKAQSTDRINAIQQQINALQQELRRMQQDAARRDAALREA